MAIIALVSSDCKSKGLYLESREMPVNYMGDFSILGFSVDRYNEAFDLLVTAGYQLSRKKAGADIVITSRHQCEAIRDLLLSNKIQCDFTDIVDTLYQA